MAGKWEPQTGLGRVVDKFEENAIAVILGLMTLLTFVNVVRRYVFNTSLIWSLEVVLVLFSWLVLFGISYGFKVTAHLGVDAVINIVPRRWARFLGVLAALVCLAYALLIFKGAWDYWAPFADLPPTKGRWLPTGIDWTARSTSYFETDQIPMPGFLSFLADWINYGEAYDKMPRTIPYMILPIGAALLLFRIAQVSLRLILGRQDSLIVSHEAEDAVEEVAAMNRES
ncbi:MAG: TRAP transporter small permease subunit [Limimaricola sp.]|uniref:TRAP transporter small permease n=1 Tax=Limimaricola sp. TaxID=2211665 RepID=UPI001D88649F|nr:TRAP transporter small permease [Limimaricola sp.]MBI1418431.1 TRAP transporter small permease subunit [Limimaricola sp.]